MSNDLFTRQGAPLPVQRAKQPLGKARAPRPAPAPQEPSPLGCAAALAGLSGEQEAVATTKAKRTVVEAGAGTGKTRALAARLAHLHGAGVRPGRIIAVTFTNKAAGEIRDRVARYLGKPVAKQIRIGTFHSLSARILRRYAKEAGLERNFQIIDQDDVHRVLRDAVVNSGVAGAAAASDEAHARQVGDIVDRADRRIKQWKSWGITPEGAAALAPDVRNEEDPMLARVYASYQDDMRRRNRVDFGDLVLKVVMLLEGDDELRDKLSEHVEHLVVDEAQDANPAQVKWVELIADHHRCVMAIGDPDQSIFSFQGGYPGALHDMTRGGRTTLPLTLNRRCTAQILAPAVKLVGHNNRSEPKHLVSERQGPEPTLRLCGNELEEATYIATHVKGLISGGADPAEIAILFRSAWLMRTVEEAFIKAGINHVLVGGNSLSGRADVRDLRAYLLLSLDQKDDLSFGRVFNTPLRGLGAAACDFVVSRMVERGETCLEACRLTHFEDRTPLPHQWREGLEALSGHVELMAALAQAGTDAEGEEIGTARLLDYILSDQGIGFEAHVRRTKDRKELKARLDTLAAVRRIAGEYPAVRDFTDMVALAGEGEHVREAGAVTLTTMHSSKGLEWDHVVCPAFDAAAIPSPRALEDNRSDRIASVWNGAGGGMDEERRLAHVAFTRAKQTLTVTTRMSRAGRPIPPSVFLAESGLEKILDVDAYERSRVAPVGRTKSADRAGRVGFSRRRTAPAAR